jgi:hypothetical protein
MDSQLRKGLVDTAAVRRRCRELVEASQKRIEATRRLVEATDARRRSLLQGRHNDRLFHEEAPRERD